ncbi:MAG: amidohydrolase [Rhodothermales bacterium]|nr:amidohydrolase [Rhodothermales bacterium]MBO6780662.1 amidohydrolase [Rhodothermales bacterium]
MSRLFLVLATLWVAGPASAQTTELFADVMASWPDLEAAVVEARHDIHQHPELSAQEYRTAEKVAEWLERYGWEVRRGIAETGVVGVLNGGLPGPLVAFRADMDAVESTAPDPVPYASLTPGIRHICGHDVHTAVGLGLAAVLAEARDRLPGAVMLIFQPAEERADGASRMLEDGLFEEHLPEAVFALHTAPYSVGHVATMPGGMMVSRSWVHVDITGSGDLDGAAAAARSRVMAESTVAPMAASFPSPPDAVLVQLAPTRGSGDSRTIRGQLMTGSPVILDRLARTFAAMGDSLSSADVRVEARLIPAAIPGVQNDATLVEQSNASLARLTPDVTVHGIESVVPAFSEDFGHFQRHTPGVMYFLGVGRQGLPHSAGYVADDAAIGVGVRAMTAVMLDRLSVQDG